MSMHDLGHGGNVGLSKLCVSIIRRSNVVIFPLVLSSRKITNTYDIKYRILKRTAFVQETNNFI